MYALKKTPLFPLQSRMHANRYRPVNKTIDKEHSQQQYEQLATTTDSERPMKEMRRYHTANSIHSCSSSTRIVAALSGYNYLNVSDRYNFTI